MLNKINYVLISTWNGMSQALLFLILAVISIQLEGIKRLLKVKLTAKQKEEVGVKEIPYTDIVSVLKAMLGK
jgi:hypothetical protein